MIDDGDERGSWANEGRAHSRTQCAVVTNFQPERVRQRSRKQLTKRAAARAKQWSGLTKLRWLNGCMCGGRPGACKRAMAHRARSRTTRDWPCPPALASTRFRFLPGPDRIIGARRLSPGNTVATVHASQLGPKAALSLTSPLITTQSQICNATVMSAHSIVLP
jgi:hypothetical protein